jgi:hypothetical protein
VTGAFVPPADGRWTSAVQACPHDIYHQPRYAELAARTEGGVPIAFVDDVGGRPCLIPLLERPLPAWMGADGVVDLTSPYGYPSPLVGHIGEPDLRAVLRAFVDSARERGAVTAFVRLHPLLPIPDALLRELGTVVVHGPTVVVDLRRTTDAIAADIRSGYRYDMRRLRRSGYVAAIDQWDRFDDFMHLYADTMQRVGAASSYLFGHDYFRGLREALGDALHLITVVAPNGETAAAGLVSVCGAIAQYHLSGSHAAHAALAPTKLLLETAIDVARERGAAHLHLGGGVGGREDSLFSFKAGFSSGRATFATWRVIVDPACYDELSARWSARTGRPAEPSHGYFPAYRMPAERRETSSRLEPAT